MVGNEESTGDRDAIATATRVVGIKEGNDEGGKGDGNGNGNKEGNGNQWQQHGQWRRQRGWQASNGSDNGNGDGDGMKDMAAHAMPGERGMMVAMGHGLCVSFCVCGETTKNKAFPIGNFWHPKIHRKHRKHTLEKYMLVCLTSRSVQQKKHWTAQKNIKT